MPYLFVSDGAPEAEEFETNYFWFDADDPVSLKEALAESQLHGRRNARSQGAGERLPLRALVLRGRFADRPA